MAKNRLRRMTAASLDGLAATLRDLDARRAAVAKQLRQATEKLLSGENPFPLGQKRGARKAKRTGRRRKMSAAARQAISNAQKARWAKQRSAATKAK